MKNKLFFGSIIILTFSFFNSCAKKLTTREVCSTRNPDKLIPLTFRSENRAFIFTNVAVWKFSKPSIQENADFGYSNLNDLLPNKNIDATDPFLILFYIDKLIGNDQSFSEGNIAAYSKYSLSDKLLQHDFYQKINNEYKKIDFLSIKISLVSDNAIEYIRNNIVFKNNSSNTTVLSISNGKKLNYQSPDHEDNLYKAAKIYAEKSNNSMLF